MLLFETVEEFSLKERLSELLERSKRKGYLWYYVTEQNLYKDFDALDKTSKVSGWITSTFTVQLFRQFKQGIMRSTYR